MSVKKFFTCTGHNCFKALKSMTTSLQKKLRKNSKVHHSPIASGPIKGRESVSTEITLLEYDNSQNCRNFLTEISENQFNETVEKHCRCYKDNV
ncbi:hypothetical protein WA026_008853 [Henosepilachna vigintioctopunctata]|uniref:Uncharacterized protein n=1 Tax=Henosepilachna vigintioctopunctata TaxID=420089 RepID=A0AAW1VCE8_9CUCU